MTITALFDSLGLGEFGGRLQRLARPSAAHRHVNALTRQRHRDRLAYPTTAARDQRGCVI